MKSLVERTSISLFNNKNTRKMCETCSELTIKTPERRQWHRSGVFIVNFEQISQIFLVFLLLTLSKLMLAGEKLIKELFLYLLKTQKNKHFLMFSGNIERDHCMKWLKVFYKSYFWKFWGKERSNHPKLVP